MNREQFSIIERVKGLVFLSFGKSELVMESTNLLSIKSNRYINNKITKQPPKKQSNKKKMKMKIMMIIILIKKKILLYILLIGSV